MCETYASTNTQCRNGQSSSLKNNPLIIQKKKKKTTEHTSNFDSGYAGVL